MFVHCSALNKMFQKYHKFKWNIQYPNEPVMPKSVRTEALANVFQICLSASAAAANVAMQPPAIAKASDTHTHTL